MVSVGDKIRIITKSDNHHYDGKIGIVVYVDSDGLIYGTWGDCTLIPGVDRFETLIIEESKWHFRDNKKRKIGGTNKGAHPSLVIGETDNGQNLINIGLTKNPKRGHHKNTKIHNPQNWNHVSYLRDDIRIDSKEHLSKILEEYNLCPDDIDEIWKIIKKRIPTRR